MMFRVFFVLACFTSVKIAVAQSALSDKQSVTLSELHFMRDMISYAYSVQGGCESHHGKSEYVSAYAVGDAPFYTINVNLQIFDRTLSGKFDGCLSSVLVNGSVRIGKLEKELLITKLIAEKKIPSDVSPNAVLLNIKINNAIQIDN